MHCKSHRRIYICGLNGGRNLCALSYADDHVLRLQIHERCRKAPLQSVRAVKTLAVGTLQEFSQTCAHMLRLFIWMAQLQSSLHKFGCMLNSASKLTSHTPCVRLASKVLTPIGWGPSPNPSPVLIYHELDWDFPTAMVVLGPFAVPLYCAEGLCVINSRSALMLVGFPTFGETRGLPAQTATPSLVSHRTLTCMELYHLTAACPHVMTCLAGNAHPILGHPPQVIPWALRAKGERSRLQGEGQVASPSCIRRPPMSTARSPS